MTVRALLIAIPEYPASDLPEIPSALAEVHEFAGWLRRVKGEDLDIELCDTPERTTRSALSEIIAELGDRGAGTTSEFHFYFAGHGANFTDQRQMAPLLLTSDFKKPQNSGFRLLVFDEVREYFLRTFGPGQHFYFINACRNRVGSDELVPSNLGLVIHTFATGMADCCHTLFSSAPDNFATNNDEFSAALLDGLEGREDTRARVKQGYAVTFHKLEQFLEQKLGARGDSASHCDGILRAGLSAPQVSVRIRGAGPEHRFRVEIRDEPPPRVVEFNGGSHTIPIAPGWYEIVVESAQGTVTPADPPGPLRVFKEHTLTYDFVPAPPGPGPRDATHGEDPDLVDFSPPDFRFVNPRSTRFDDDDDEPVRSPGARRRHADISISPLASTVRLRGPAMRRVQAVDASGRTRAARHFDRRGEASLVLPAGEYQVVVEDLDGSELVRQWCDFHPGTNLARTLVAHAGSRIHAAVLEALGSPGDAATVRFSPDLDDVAERDLGLWLAALGAIDILRGEGGPPDPLALSWTGIEDAALCLLVARDDPATEVRARLDANAPWLMARRVPGLAGVHDVRLDGAAGPRILACRLGDGPVVHTATHLRRGHVTLVTCHEDASSSTGLAVHQYFLPLPATVPAAARAPSPDLVRRSWRAQREFAKKRVLMPREGARDPFLSSCMEAAGFEPLTAILAVYELLRRGVPPDDPSIVATIDILVAAHADLPDVAPLHRLRGGAGEEAVHAPMFADALTLARRPRLPAVPGRLVFDQLWTTWLENPQKRRAKE